MSKNKIKKEKVISKVKLAGSKKGTKIPKFKLISYTLKAVIPTGMYANIQPEITVEAESIQEAERAVMPYIEEMFAKYRSDGSQVPTATVVSNSSSTQAQVVTRPQATAKALEPVKESQPVLPAPVEAPIVMTVPFNRAKSALESCTSLEALRLVSDQITKSVKLTPEEKNTLIMLSTEIQPKITREK